MRHAARGAARAPARRRLARGADRGRRCGAPAAVKREAPLWLVLPDPLPTRVFFDCGIVDRLRERLAGPARARLRRRGSRAVARAGWATCPCSSRRRCSRRGSALGERVRRRVDRFLDDHAGFYPLALRVSLRHGFHRERMRRGHDNWFLDPDRAGPLPRWAAARARDVPLALQRRAATCRRALLRRMREDCAGLVVANLQTRSAVPFLTAARRLGIPVVGYVSSWDHTVGKGAISPYARALRRPERDDAARPRPLPRHRRRSASR